MSPGKDPIFYAAKKLFIKNMNSKQEEEIFKNMPLALQTRYKEILEGDKTLSLRKLKAGTNKMFIREI